MISIVLSPSASEIIGAKLTFIPDPPTTAITALDEQASLLHCEVKFPFPLSNRDYVYSRHVKQVGVSGS